MSRHSPCKQKLQRRFWLHVPFIFRHFGGLGALWGALGRGPGFSFFLQNVQIHDAHAHVGHVSILSRPLSIQSEQHVLTLLIDIISRGKKRLITEAQN